MYYNYSQQRMRYSFNNIFYLINLYYYMNCTIITPSMGALNGASQSAVDLALACAQTYENLSIIYKHKSKIPETIDGYSFKSIKADL